MLPDFSSVPHHPALEEIVDIICSKVQEPDRGFFRTEVAYFLGKIASTMRATIVAKGIGESIPANVYAIALAESGFGKGHSMSIMENQVLEDFVQRFYEDTFPVISDQNLWAIANANAVRSGKDPQEEYEKVSKEFHSAGPYTFSFDGGSASSIKQLRYKLLMANIGTLNLQIDEIGSNLTSQVEALTTFLELFDLGMIKQKLKMHTKDQKRSEDINGKTPANMLLFGTPARLFDGSSTEDVFYSLLETGFARRCLFGWGTKTKGKVNLTPEEEARQMWLSLNAKSVNSTLHKWKNHFYDLANPTMYNWQIEVPDDVGIALLEYRIECERKAEEMPDHDFVRKAEMGHRHSKALRLAGTYAFIDKSINIEMDHLYAAIKLVEESGACFDKILNREKSYMKLARYIVQATKEGKEVTHSDLSEALPFYSGQSNRNELMTMARSWGYKNHIIIKNSFADGVELFTGETLEETNLNELIFSWSVDFATGYKPEKAPWDQLHILTQHDGLHWCNHYFKDGHRNENNVVPGFNCIVLDVDEGISLEHAHELMKDYRFLSYTTKRHQTPGYGDRFRMILPMNYTLKLSNDEYKEFMQNIFNWVPFTVDLSYDKREKKSLSHNGSFFYNNDGELLDVTRFIPKTSRNEEFRKQAKQLASLDNLERWFAQRMGPGNRNNEMIKFALCLVDSGTHDFVTVRNLVHSFNKKLSSPLSETEIDTTILKTVARKIEERQQRKAA